MEADVSVFNYQFTQGLHRTLDSKPDRIATICGDRTRTYREHGERVARLAGGLAGLDVRRGDRVAILSLNSDRYLEYYLAVPWIGAWVNPVNFRWSLEEIIYCMNDSGSRVLFVDDMFAKVIGEVKAGCPTLETIIFCGDGDLPDGCMSYEALIAQSAPVEDVRACGDDIYGLFYTGGTTGRSKGVMLSHKNVVASAFAALAEGMFGDGAVALHAAPMFHLADFTATSSLNVCGGTHVFLGAFHPERLHALIAAHNVTDLLLVPVMMQMTVDHPGMAGADMSSVRRLYYGGSPASEALIDRVVAALPGVRLSQVYGMTETAATITMLRAAEHQPENRVPGRMRSGGSAFLHTLVKIFDADDREVARGEVGEIVVRGANIMSGYFNKPEETETTLRGGWMHTGDLGYMDEAGFVFIVDRSKDMIISGGENVYSTEVENVVASHPAVSACAVIGIPSDEWGEQVHAVIVPKPGAQLELDDLIAHCRQKIAGYKCPRSMKIVEAIPVSGAGKFLKTELRKPYWEGLARSIN